MSIQKFRESFAVSGTVKLIVAGDYFRLGMTNYPVAVRFFRGSAINSEMANIDGGTWTKIAGGFDAVEVINSASGAQTLDIFIGSGEVGIDRIVGEVSVINGEISRVKSLNCFIGYSTSTGGAGLYPQVQLFNPVGSGKNLILNKASVILSVAGGAGLLRGSVQLLNSSGAGSNKFLGKSNSLGVMRNEAAAAVVAGTLIGTVVPPANDQRDFLFSEPLLIEPGLGVSFYCANPTSTATCIWQWIEENI